MKRRDWALLVSLMAAQTTLILGIGAFAFLRLEARMDRLEARMDRMEERLDNLDRRVARIEGPRRYRPELGAGDPGYRPDLSPRAGDIEPGAIRAGFARPRGPHREGLGRPEAGAPSRLPCSATMRGAG